MIKFFKCKPLNNPFNGKPATSWEILAFAVSILTLLGCSIYLLVRWEKKAELYSDNIAIEVGTGIILSIIPLYAGIKIGGKIKSDLFHFRIKEILKLVAQKKKKGSLTSDDAQQLVKAIVSNLGHDIINESWSIDVDKKTGEKVDCGICGKLVPNIDKCSVCKLNCFAWKLED